MEETKPSNGVSGKRKAVKTEQVSKLEGYANKLELVGIDFSAKDRIYEKTSDTDNANSGDSAEGTTGKKEVDIGQSLYIDAGNTVQFEFDPKALEAQHLQKGLKGKEREEAEQEQNGQEK